MGPLVVIGPVGLDIISQAKQSLSQASVGDIRMSLGGVAYMTALAATAVGHPCRLVPVMRPSPFSEMVEEILTERGAEVRVLYDNGLPLSGYCAHLGRAGNLISAINATPSPGLDLNTVDLNAVLSDAGALVLDYGMSSGILRALLSQANAYQIPVFLIGRSGEERLRELVGMYSPDVICVDHDGFRRLARTFGDGSAQPSAGELANLLRTTLAMFDTAAGQVSVAASMEVSYSPLRGLAEVARRESGLMYLLMVMLVAEINRCPYFDVAMQRALASLEDHVQAGVLKTIRADPIESTIDELYSAAKTDPLTGVENRRAIENAMNSSLLHGFISRGEFALLLLDIDDFKSINDTWGHDVGDKVMRWSADILRRAVRESDIIGRWGGDEFIVLLPGTNPNHAVEVAERIRLSIVVGSAGARHLPRTITASVGVALAMPGEDVRSSLLVRADRALYSAKRGGRNRVFYARTDTRSTTQLDFLSAFKEDGKRAGGAC